MADTFFEKPILNTPYDCPSRHWELEDGLPTGRKIGRRRPADFVTPIPKPKKNRAEQMTLIADSDLLSTQEQRYDPAEINELRRHIDEWRNLPNREHWSVTPETAQLLHYWRHYDYGSMRPFFCQVEAVETAIWLTEVAPRFGKKGRRFLDLLEQANEEANPGMPRMALKLATGAGKTMVMAMLIAWQAINAAKRPNSKKFARGFLIVTPGITIRDRLRVLLPSDPDNYYERRDLVPQGMLKYLNRAKIVITNYHSFKRREKLNLPKGNRALLQGRGPEIQSLESEGEMLQRSASELLSLRRIVVINDEAHHCYREKPGKSEEGKLKGDDRKEAEKNKEAARLWINGLQAFQSKLDIQRVFDLSATPSFLRGSGYIEGTLFPWTVSDFSLMDAIECGIVKLPRVPVADNIPSADVPVFRELWKHVGTKMPKKGRGKSGVLDPLSLPVELQTALGALYGHYEKTFHKWQEAGIEVPPCFIVVCNNTSTSKLIYDYISGFERKTNEGQLHFENGRLELFQNYDEAGNRFARPRTLLIDSEQLESGDALDKKFREMAKHEIEQFRRDQASRYGSHGAQEFTDQDLLREVMNTVGKRGHLGGSIRCVVSVSMLTEGWDANTVTHVLGVRAFGTQLLCEQVIGRALRRQNYDVNDEGLFNVEYADVLGIPFDFTSEAVIAPPQPPRQTTQVKAVSPERDALEIRFPRVDGYRTEIPDQRLEAEFDDDSTLVLTPDLIGPSVTRNEGILGQGVNLDLVHTENVRLQSLAYQMTHYLIEKKWRDIDEAPRYQLFGQLRAITLYWLKNHLECVGGTTPGQLLYKELLERACERINRGIVKKMRGSSSIKAVMDPYNPVGSTRHVSFTTTRSDDLWRTAMDKCHVNYVVYDSDWESEFCRVAESHPQVLAYVKNHNLGFEVPYRSGATSRRYRPDFIVRVDDGRGAQDPLNLVVEVKGYRHENAKDKKDTMETFWLPAVNRLGSFGRWAFAEFGSVYRIEAEFEAKIQQNFEHMIDSALTGSTESKSA